MGIERNPLFERMYEAGERLIKASKIEDSLSQLYAQSRTPQRLKRWKEARRIVEELAGQYAKAIRDYRLASEYEQPAAPHMVKHRIN